MAGQLVQAQVLGQVLVDVGHHLVDVLVFAHVLPDAVRQGEVRPV